MASLKSKISGFTLIELLTVIFIISVLSSIVAGITWLAKHKSEDSRRITEIHNFGTAFEICYGEKGDYPDNLYLGYDLSFWHDGINFLWNGSCSTCWRYFLNYVKNDLIAKNCDFTFQMRDPVNIDPLSYTYFYFKPGAAHIVFDGDGIQLNPQCAGHYAFMARLDKTQASPGAINCFQSFDDPNSAYESYWFLLGG